MSSTWNRMKRTLGIVIPVSITVLAASGGVAHAQFTLEGSDTLTDVIKDSIAGSGANLVYSNLGSGQGEKDIAQLGCPSAGITKGNFQESIAPMSRNFQAVITSWCPTWAPSTNNVIGLDAAVFSTNNYAGRCLNQTVPLKCIKTDPVTHLCTTWDPTLAEPTTPSDLSILLFGYNTSGTGHGLTSECADSHRIAALNRLITCMGVNDVTHIYRRDDNSGTQDTLREHFQFNYWCNGKAEGNVTSPTNSNVLNEDLDPIRRPCIPPDGSHAKTRCTFYPTAESCSDPLATINHPTYGTLKCTQGLIVALSENDPGSDDITLSIANRVKNDGFNQTVGVAGRASIELPGQPTAGMTVNTVSFSDVSVRANQYMLSRRLFLQRNPSPAPTYSPARLTEENKLFTWATNRCNMYPIIKAHGFVTCLDVCTDAVNDPANLCVITPGPGSSIPKQSIGAESYLTFTDLSDNTHPCVEDATILASGACASIPAQGTGAACNLSSKCTNGTCTLDSSNISGVCN
jgi:hypothetical protein